MKDWRIVLLVAMVVLSIGIVAAKGLSFGIDFTGGTELKLELKEGGEDVVDAVVTILKDRLNGMGLKSTQVLKEVDGKHIAVKVSTTDPEDLRRIREIINQQATFEQYVEGELCARGQEIQLDITQQGGAFIAGNEWQVFVKTTGEAPARCGKVMQNKAGHMTDVFLDRPQNAFILMDSATCTVLSATEFSNNAGDEGYTQLSFITDRANIPVICYDESIPEEVPQETVSINSSILEELGLTIANETQNASEGGQIGVEGAVREVKNQESKGRREIILLANSSMLPKELQEVISGLNLTVTVHEKLPDQPFHINAGEASGREDNSGSWIDVVTGLKSTLSIQEGLTYGDPIYSSVFTGGADNDADAKEIILSYKIWLTSGNLPSKVDIVLERPNLPELGQQFLYYAAMMALVSLVLVSVIISIRYRHLKLSVAILITSFSELIIVLGFASLSSWELDMAAMAGIIATIGTGVDHQIVITDETLRGERKKRDNKIWDIQQSINRAFFIIMTSAATIICAMLPLMSIIDLRGFAFTSIVGVLIGIAITRPAYSRIIEKII